MWPAAGPPVEVGQQGVRPRGARLPVGGGVRGLSPPPQSLCSVPGPLARGIRLQGPLPPQCSEPLSSVLGTTTSFPSCPLLNGRTPPLSCGCLPVASLFWALSVDRCVPVQIQGRSGCVCQSQHQPRLGHHFPDRTMPKPASHPLSSPPGVLKLWSPGLARRPPTHERPVP